MQTAQNTPSALAFVVLHEVGLDSGRFPRLLVVGFKKVTSFIGEHPGVHLVHAGQGSGDKLHGR